VSCGSEKEQIEMMPSETASSFDSEGTMMEMASTGNGVMSQQHITQRMNRITLVDITCSSSSSTTPLIVTSLRP
jgi:hypothetical protein